MFTNIFESRNKTFLNLVKLGDYLGRSLRESVELFSVDGDAVIYLTESNKVISGKFSQKPLSLTNIEVRDSEIFENKEVYNRLVDAQVSKLLADLLENDLSKAEDNFDKTLKLWESKLQFTKTQKRLNDKASRFDESYTIVASPEFKRVVELKGDLVKLLKENKKAANSPAIRSSVRLSSVISKSFNLPRISYESLTESKKYAVPTTVNTSLYDHLCKQEVITKELAESKGSFDTIWITNEKIQKLPSMIYESDDKVMEAIAEIVAEIPYFALASKKQLAKLVEGNLDLIIDEGKVPNRDIKEFVTKVHGFTRPIKTHIISILNEKYGINVQTLTSEPTLKSLVETESLIFKGLAELAPKDSNLKRALVEMSEALISKNGVESIDVADFLTSIFESGEVETNINETSLMNYLNFDRVADDLGKIGAILKTIQAGAAAGMMGGGGGAPMPGQAMPQGNPVAPMAQKGMAQGAPIPGMEDSDGQYEPDGLGSMGDMGGEEEDAGAIMQGDDELDPAMDAEAAAGEAGMEGEMEGEEGMMDGEGDPDAEFSDKDVLVDNLKELEELIATLKSDLDLGDEGEMGMEGEPGAEDIVIDGEEGDDDIHVDVNSHDEEESGEGEFEEGGDDEEYEDDDEEEAPPKKKKPKPEVE